MHFVEAIGEYSGAIIFTMLTLSENYGTYTGSIY